MIEEFTITENHLKLISNMYFYFDNLGYDGAPAVDCKRPYGNSGNQAYEIHRVITNEEWDFGDYDDNEMSEELQNHYMNLHRETATVLQICCSLQEFKTGTYRKTCRYDSHSWKEIK